MADEPSTTRLSEPEVDLATIASVHRLDRYLAELASLTEGGVETVVGLLISGNVVVGRTVSEDDMAKEVDQHLLTVIEMNAAASSDPDSWSQTKSDLAGKHLEGAAERREARAKMIARHAAEFGDTNPLPTEMPRDLARDVIADHNRVVLTLADASVFPPGTQEPLKVSVMRVDLRQVGAWWIVPTDPETRSASFSYPGSH